MFWILFWIFYAACMTFWAVTKKVRNERRLPVRVYPEPRLPFGKQRDMLVDGEISPVSFVLRVEQLFEERVKQLRERDTNWEALDWTTTALEPEGLSYRWDGDTLVKVETKRRDMNSVLADATNHRYVNAPLSTHILVALGRETHTIAQILTRLPRVERDVVAVSATLTGLRERGLVRGFVDVNGLTHWRRYV